MTRQLAELVAETAETRHRHRRSYGAGDLRALANAAEASKYDPVRLAIEAERVTAPRRQWAAMMITRHVDVYEAIVLGKPVIAARLDGEVLRRALRGGPLPDPSAFIEVTDEMLDAVSEAGVLAGDQGRRKR